MAVMRFVCIFADDFQNIVINKITFASVNSEHAVLGHFV